MVRQRPGFGVDDEIPALVEPHFTRAGDVECDVRGRGAGPEHEVVLELLLSAVVHQVDAGVDVVVRDSRVSRNTGSPPARVIANEVTGSAGQLTVRRGLDPGAPSRKPDRDRFVPLTRSPERHD